MLQAQKKFWGKRPGFDFGDIIHFLANASFVLALFVMVRAWSVPLLAFLLVILSKWRTFAVQPRFWIPNIKANTVDVVVGLGTIILMNQAPGDTSASFFAVLFLIWVLYIKPKDSDAMVGVQAMWAQFLGITAVFMVNSLLEYSILGIIAIWIITWSTARHFLANYEEPHYKTLALVWAFMMSQIAWIGFHWIIFHHILDIISIPNVALIISTVSMTVGLLYHAYRSDNLKKNKIMEDLIFGGLLLFIIFILSILQTINKL